MRATSSSGEMCAPSMRCCPSLAVQLYDLRDYEDGPCNFYFIQRRKCFARYHPGAYLLRCCPSHER